MVIQKQNNLRYTKTWNIFLIWILTIIFVIWFGILIQKSENDILTLSSQIKSESEQIRQKTHIRVQQNKDKKNELTNTWTQLSTWGVLGTWKK